MCTCISRLIDWYSLWSSLTKKTGFYLSRVICIICLVHVGESILLTNMGCIFFRFYVKLISNFLCLFLCLTCCLQRNCIILRNEIYLSFLELRVVKFLVLCIFVIVTQELFTCNRLLYWFGFNFFLPQTKIQIKDKKKKIRIVR